MRIHASYNFSSEEWARIPDHEKEALRQERAAYKRRNTSNASIVSEVTQAIIGELRQAGSLPPPPEEHDQRSLPPPTVPRTIMGGRNEQANRRGNN